MAHFQITCDVDTLPHYDVNGKGPLPCYGAVLSALPTPDLDNDPPELIELCMDMMLKPWQSWTSISFHAATIGNFDGWQISLYADHALWKHFKRIDAAMREDTLSGLPGNHPVSGPLKAWLTRNWDTYVARELAKTEPAGEWSPAKRKQALENIANPDQASRIDGSAQGRVQPFLRYQSNLLRAMAPVPQIGNLSHIMSLDAQTIPKNNGFLLLPLFNSTATLEDSDITDTYSLRVDKDDLLKTLQTDPNKLHPRFFPDDKKRSETIAVTIPARIVWVPDSETETEETRFDVEIDLICRILPLDNPARTVMAGMKNADSTKLWADVTLALGESRTTLVEDLARGLSLAEPLMENADRLAVIPDPDDVFDILAYLGLKSVKLESRLDALMSSAAGAGMIAPDQSPAIKSHLSDMIADLQISNGDNPLNETARTKRRDLLAEAWHKTGLAPQNPFEKATEAALDNRQFNCHTQSPVACSLGYQKVDDKPHLLLTIGHFPGGDAKGTDPADIRATLEQYQPGTAGFMPLRDMEAMAAIELDPWPPKADISRGPFHFDLTALTADTRFDTGTYRLTLSLRSTPGKEPETIVFRLSADEIVTVPFTALRRLLAEQAGIGAVFEVLLARAGQSLRPETRSLSGPGVTSIEAGKAPHEAARLFGQGDAALRHLANRISEPVRTRIDSYKEDILAMLPLEEADAETVRARDLDGPEGPADKDPVVEKFNQAIENAFWDLEEHINSASKTGFLPHSTKTTMSWLEDVIIDHRDLYVETVLEASSRLKPSAKPLPIEVRVGAPVAQHEIDKSVDSLNERIAGIGLLVRGEGADGWQTPNAVRLHLTEDKTTPLDHFAPLPLDASDGVLMNSVYYDGAPLIATSPIQEILKAFAPEGRLQGSQSYITSQAVAEYAFVKEPEAEWALLPSLRYGRHISVAAMLMHLSGALPVEVAHPEAHWRIDRDKLADKGLDIPYDTILYQRTVPVASLRLDAGECEPQQEGPDTAGIQIPESKELPVLARDLPRLAVQAKGTPRSLHFGADGLGQLDFRAPAWSLTIPAIEIRNFGKGSARFTFELRSLLGVPGKDHSRADRTITLDLDMRDIDDDQMIAETQLAVSHRGKTDILTGRILPTGGDEAKEGAASTTIQTLLARAPLTLTLAFADEGAAGGRVTLSFDSGDIATSDPSRPPIAEYEIKDNKHLSAFMRENGGFGFTADGVPIPGTIASIGFGEPALTINGDAIKPGDEDESPIALLARGDVFSKAVHDGRVLSQFHIRSRVPATAHANWDRWIAGLSEEKDGPKNGLSIKEIRQCGMAGWLHELTKKVVSEDGGAGPEIAFNDPAIGGILVEATPLFAPEHRKAHRELFTLEPPWFKGKPGDVDLKTCATLFPDDPVSLADIAQTSRFGALAKAGRSPVKPKDGDGETTPPPVGPEIGAGETWQISCYPLIFLTPADKRFTQSVRELLREETELSTPGIRAYSGPETRILVETATDQVPSFDEVRAGISIGRSGQTIRVSHDGDSRLPHRYEGWRWRNHKYYYLHDLELHRQAWRWTGRPLDDYPFSHTGKYFDFPELIKGAVPIRVDADQERKRIGATLSWEVKGFADRSAYDFLRSRHQLSAGGKTLLQTEDLTGEERALYYRFRLNAFSRYYPVANRDTASRLALTHIEHDKSDQNRFYDEWRRVYVPVIRPETVKPPGIRLVIPLTQGVGTDAGNSEAPPPLLVILDEPWFANYGLAEVLVPEISESLPLRLSPPEGAGGGEAHIQSLQEVSADPVLSGKAWGEYQPDYGDWEKTEFVPSARLRLRAEGPIGYTYDEDVSAPSFSNSAFLLHVEPVQKNDPLPPDRSMIGVRFRRVLPPEAIDGYMAPDVKIVPMAQRYRAPEAIELGARSLDPVQVNLLEFALAPEHDDNQHDITLNLHFSIRLSDKSVIGKKIETVNILHMAQTVAGSNATGRFGGTAGRLLRVLTERVSVRRHKQSHTSHDRIYETWRVILQVFDRDRIRAFDIGSRHISIDFEGDEVLHALSGQLFSTRTPSEPDEIDFDKLEAPHTLAASTRTQREITQFATDFRKFHTEPTHERGADTLGVIFTDELRARRLASANDFRIALTRRDSAPDETVRLYPAGAADKESVFEDRLYGLVMEQVPDAFSRVSERFHSLLGFQTDEGTGISTLAPLAGEKAVPAVADSQFTLRIVQVELRRDRRQLSTRDPRQIIAIGKGQARPNPAPIVLEKIDLTVGAALHLIITDRSGAHNAKVTITRDKDGYKIGTEAIAGADLMTGLRLWLVEKGGSHAILWQRAADREDPEEEELAAIGELDVRFAGPDTAPHEPAFAHFILQGEHEIPPGTNPLRAIRPNAPSGSDPEDALSRLVKASPPIPVENG